VAGVRSLAANGNASLDWAYRALWGNPRQLSNHSRTRPSEWNVVEYLGCLIRGWTRDISHCERLVYCLLQLQGVLNLRTICNTPSPSSAHRSVQCIRGRTHGLGGDWNSASFWGPAKLSRWNVSGQNNDHKRHQLLASYHSNLDAITYRLYVETFFQCRRSHVRGIASKYLHTDVEATLRWTDSQSIFMAIHALTPVLVIMVVD
jgi:hypothetical protein